MSAPANGLRPFGNPTRALRPSNPDPAGGLSEGPSGRHLAGEAAPSNRA